MPIAKQSKKQTMKGLVMDAWRTTAKLCSTFRAESYRHPEGSEAQQYNAVWADQLAESARGLRRVNAYLLEKGKRKVVKKNA